MTEVVEFTGKFFPLQKIIEEHVGLIKDKIPDNLYEVLLGMNIDGLRESLTRSNFERLSWKLFGDENDQITGMSFCTRVRKHLVPEFGVTKHTDFITFSWRDSDPTAPIGESSPPSIEEVHSALTAYYTEKFPDTTMANRIALSYVILTVISSNAKFRITQYGFDEEESCFTVEFKELASDDGAGRDYSMKCDFLPILLDSIALDWYAAEHPE